MVTKWVNCDGPDKTTLPAAHRGREHVSSIKHMDEVR